MGQDFIYTGLFPSRNEDITALGIAQSRRSDRFLSLNPDSVNAETAIELTHSSSLGRGIRLQPDVQYILDPGTDQSIGNALIIGTRVEVIY